MGGIGGESIGRGQSAGGKLWTLLNIRKYVLVVLLNALDYQAETW